MADPLVALSRLTGASPNQLRKMRPQQLKKMMRQALKEAYKFAARNPEKAQEALESLQMPPEQAKPFQDAIQAGERYGAQANGDFKDLEASANQFSQTSDVADKSFEIEDKPVFETQQQSDQSLQREFDKKLAAESAFADQYYQELQIAEAQMDQQRFQAEQEAADNAIAGPVLPETRQELEIVKAPIEEEIGAGFFEKFEQEAKKDPEPEVGPEPDKLMPEVPVVEEFKAETEAPKAEVEEVKAKEPKTEVETPEPVKKSGPFSVAELDAFSKKNQHTHHKMPDAAKKELVGHLNDAAEHWQEGNKTEAMKSLFSAVAVRLSHNNLTEALSSIKDFVQTVREEGFEGLKTLATDAVKNMFKNSLIYQIASKAFSEKGKDLDVAKSIDVAKTEAPKISAQAATVSEKPQPVNTLAKEISQKSQPVPDRTPAPEPNRNQSQQPASEPVRENTAWAKSEVFKGKTAYEALGVEPTASQAAIQTAYKKLAMKYHPDKADKNGLTKDQATSAFQDLANARDSAIARAPVESATVQANTAPVKAQSTVSTQNQNESDDVSSRSPERNNEQTNNSRKSSLMIEPVSSPAPASSATLALTDNREPAPAPVTSSPESTITPKPVAAAMPEANPAQAQKQAQSALDLNGLLKMPGLEAPTPFSMGSRSFKDMDREKNRESATAAAPAA